MAHKKAGGSSRNGRDSAGRRLGVKKFGGEIVISETLLFVKEAQTFFLVEMSKLDGIIRCLQLPKVRFLLVRI